MSSRCLTYDYQNRTVLTTMGGFSSSPFCFHTNGSLIASKTFGSFFIPTSFYCLANFMLRNACFMQTDASLKQIKNVDLPLALHTALLKFDLLPWRILALQNFASGELKYDLPLWHSVLRLIVLSCRSSSIRCLLWFVRDDFCMKLTPFRDNKHSICCFSWMNQILY